MKLNLKVVALVLAISNLTYACPEISGNWLCVDMQNSNRRVEYKISQEPIDGGVSYTLKESKGSTVYQADGVLYSYDEGDVSGSKITKCVGENNIESIEQATLKPFNLHTVLIAKIEKSNNEKIRISYIARAEIQGTIDSNESKSKYNCSRID